MRYLLHGATNWNSTNFGDFMYAYEIYRYLKQDPENRVGFYDPSDYFVKYLNDEATELDTVRLHEADYVIYIPGGYFGEGHNARLRDTVIQYIRFMPFGLKAACLKKKMLAIGVGAGPLDRWFMKLAVRTICKHSIAVTTRDKESQEALASIGINDVPEYSDMMLAYDLNVIAKETEQIECVKRFVGNDKLLLIHYNHSNEALEKFAAAAKTFVHEHRDYKIVVVADSILPYESDYYEKFSSMCQYDTFHFVYDNPFEMLKLIAISDAILTCKLHVGVVGCMFNKAVICAAEHPEKTVRFYDLIERPQNCISLYNTSPEQISEKMRCLHEIPLMIPKSEREKASCHWNTIQRIIKN